MANKINNNFGEKEFNPVDMPYADEATKKQNKSNTVKKIDVKKVNTDSQKPTR